MCSTAPCSASSSSAASPNIGQKLLWLQVDDPAKTSHQMKARRRDPEEGKILEIHKGFRGWMCVEIAPAQDARRLPAASSARPASMIRAPSSGSPAARSSSISDTRLSPRMFFVCSGEPRNQQDRRGVGMAGDIDQRAIGIAAVGHKGGERALPAAAQQRAGESGSIKICGRLHRYFPAMLLQKGSFFGLDGVLYGMDASPRERFAELGHTSAQLALLVDRVRSPFMRRLAGLPAV